MTKTEVVDASLVLGFLLATNEAAVSRFPEIIKRVKNSVVELHAPELLWLETANGLRYSNLDIAKILAKFEAFVILPITAHSFSSEQLQGILNLAIQYGTTIYDTSYHYLALELDGTFFTCDKDYYRKTRSLGHINLISS